MPCPEVVCVVATARPESPVSIKGKRGVHCKVDGFYNVSGEDGREIIQFVFACAEFAAIAIALSPYLPRIIQ